MRPVDSPPHAFQGRVAFITGGASGLGKAAALQLLAVGARVVIADVEIDAAHEWTTRADARSERTAGHTVGGDAVTDRAIAVRCDVRDDLDVAQAVATAVTAFGRLDIAINAAGIGGPEVRTAEYAPDEWHRVIDVNLNGVWRAMRHEIPAMLAAGGGAIVNVSSTAGLVGFPRHPAYAASKHGVVGLTRTAALEYAKKGIRINAVCPGFTLTPMVQQMIDAGLPQAQLESRVPMGRLGTVDEVAATIVYLCSPASAFMTGHALAIDGGISAG
jgi:NAD(P)-dependent dehydrogenase (short-subunit alcohol dehydrogenase family)